MENNSEKGGWVAAAERWPGKVGAFKMRYYGKGTPGMWYIDKADDSTKSVWDWAAGNFEWWDDELIVVEKQKEDTK